jgi:cell division cycle protein 37
MPLDYSKWDNIDLSDDEEKHHQNLDRNLNIRVQRMTRDRKEEEIDKRKAELESEGKYDEAEKLEKQRPHHVGNMCKVKEERTIIHSQDGSKKDKMKKDGEEFAVDDYFEFKREHKDLLEHFTHASWERSRELLHKRGDVLLDDCANNYYMLTALDEQMAGNTDLVTKLCTQGQIISQIHQLAKPMNRPARDLVHRFFDKFESAEGQNAFREGVVHFQGHIQNRAIQKKKEQEEEEQAQMLAEEEEEETEQKAVPLIEAMYDMTPEERKGPGGLDPVEVFEGLPQELQDCFKSGDVEMMKDYARKSDPKVFEELLDRCIDAGLWKAG